MHVVVLVCILLSYSTNGIRDIYWRDYIDGDVPLDAVVEDSGVYIGQLPMNGILPGTIYPNRKVAVSECFGKKVELKNGLKIMCSNSPGKFKWVYVHIGVLTENNLVDMVIGGIEGGYTLYIGKTYHEGQWKIGKVFPASHKFRGLRLWSNSGGMHVTYDFQILKYVENDSTNISSGPYPNK